MAVFEFFRLATLRSEEQKREFLNQNSATQLKTCQLKPWSSKFGENEFQQQRKPKPLPPFSTLAIRVSQEKVFHQEPFRFNFSLFYSGKAMIAKKKQIRSVEKSSNNFEYNNFFQRDFFELPINFSKSLKKGFWKAGFVSVILKMDSFSAYKIQFIKKS